MSSTLPPQAIGTGPAPAGTSIAKPTRRVRRKKAKAPKPKSNHSAGHTYDHYKDRWASFDVDAALAEASSSESEYEYVTEEDEEATPTPATATPMTPTTGTTSTSTKSTDEPAKTLPPIRREPVTADEWRLRGNDLFRAGQYEDAVTCYERSIKVEPTAAAHGEGALDHSEHDVAELEPTLSELAPDLPADVEHTYTVEGEDEKLLRRDGDEVEGDRRDD